VVKSTGSWYRVRLDDGERIDARVRGKLRVQGIQSTNPVAVGDRVKLNTKTEGDWTIVEVCDRQNYIVRKATKLSKQTHIIAANIDLAIALVTLTHPKLKLGFLDRVLVSTEAYGIETIIVFNKIDLLNTEEKEYLNQLCKAYNDVGYETRQISVQAEQGIDQIRQIVKNKICAISGHSGVGKSSLLNVLSPEHRAQVTDVSTFNSKGQHTTTFAEMYEVDESTFIIDTPGIKSFGLSTMDREELKGFFPEMHRLSVNCKFHNCLHINEPGCAVKPAFENSQLPWFRYENYVHLFDELKEQNPL